jgi:hypothetical protein
MKGFVFSLACLTNSAMLDEDLELCFIMMIIIDFFTWHYNERILENTDDQNLRSFDTPVTSKGS